MANYTTIRGLQELKESLVYVHGDKGYLKDKENNGTTYLRCYFRSTCRGRATISNQILSPSDQLRHCCKPTSVTWEVKKAEAEMKNLARTTNRPLKEIYDNVLSNYEVAVGAEVSYSKIKSALKRERAKRVPPTPDSVEELLQNFEDGRYEKEYDAMMQGSVSVKINGEMHHAIILASSKIIEQVTTEATFYFMDGTFKTCPQLFTQVVNVIADFRGALVPIMHILMPCKKKAVYVKVFEKIAELFPTLEPQKLMTDYENGLRGALQDVFPAAKLLACRFHFSKALVKNLGQVQHMKAFLKKDCRHPLKAKLKQYLCLPLIKPEHWKEELERLKREVISLDLEEDLLKRCERFHNYIIRFWCKRIGPKQISVVGEPHKTNNACEGFHSSMRDKIPTHPKFFNYAFHLDERVLYPFEIAIEQVKKDSDAELGILKRTKTHSER